jgi:hypothetical protein
MTCAEATEHVLREAGEPMRAGEIAEEVNRRGLYVRRDGTPLPVYQASELASGSCPFIIGVPPPRPGFPLRP